MKRTLIIVLCTMLLVCACSCAPAQKQGDSEQPTATAEAPASQETTTPTEAAATEQPAPVETADNSGRQEMLLAYRSALQALLDEHKLPDGTEFEYVVPDGDDNQFAVYDVDGDGNDELVIVYISTYESGLTHAVFGFDAESGKLNTELSEYPTVVFYENGVAKAGWSHNQGLAGDFWPYTLYGYTSATDSYEAIGMVDAWSKSFAPTGADDEPFPDAVDTSGAGVVYYLIPGGQYEEVAPVNETEYKAWLAANLGDAAELQLPYLPLTEENIESLS